MQISPVGLLVCALLFAWGWYRGSALIVSLIASLAFGATALMTLGFLGGASPLIYTIFAALMVAAVATRPRIRRELGVLYGSVRPIWVLSALLVYSVIAGYLFPRLLAGQTSVFVLPPGRGAVVESTLAPVSGNISQTGYFVLGGLTAIALSILLLRGRQLSEVRDGMFLWCWLHSGMGLIHLTTQLLGAPDVLEPIRTANYAMLTDVSLSGFVRIAGAYPEASAFATASLACLAFSYTYWRRTNDRAAFRLTLLTFALVLLSTSSTAYVGMTVLSAGAVISILVSLLSNRLQADDILIVAAVAVGLVIAMTIALHDETAFDPIVELIDTTVINKLGSSSGQERMYWNVKSLQTVPDTSGLGIGLGSSRTSSWLIAVISQLGVVGSLMMAALVAVVVRGMGALRDDVPREDADVVAAVRAGTLASLVAACLTVGTADPGIIFFVGLAVVATARAKARANRLARLAAGGQAPGRATHGSGPDPGPADDYAFFGPSPPPAPR